MPEKLSQDNVIEKLKARHGDKFDYSQVVYIGMRKSITIYCNQHKGYFTQRLDTHLKTDGCATCARRKFKDSFIERSLQIHGGYYDYSKVEYVSQYDLVEVLCGKHGAFLISPKKHVLGQGCPKCSKVRKLTESHLKERIKSVHGELYTYPNGYKVAGNKDIAIKCKEHGLFMQSVYKHIIGNGCPKCGHSKKAKVRTLGQDKYIESCKAVHGDRYDLSKTIYTGYSAKVVATCKYHGDFHIEAIRFKRGFGCTTCTKIEKKKITEKSKEAWIEQFKELYGDKYIYDKASFQGREVPIEIVCPTHRSFWITPYNHSRGFDCVWCKGRRLSGEDFINRARSIFGLRYDYSNTNFTKLDSEVEIRCRKHGPFNMKARTHVSGSGCRKCVIESQLKPIDKLIEECIATQGYYYNYDKVVYERYTKMVTITCPKHGDFKQRIRSHINGSQCRKCEKRKKFILESSCEY